MDDGGRRVIHQEMPQITDGLMHGLQLWVNLPAKDKMMEPRYRGVLENELPVVTIPGGAVRVISGAYEDVYGPVKDLIVDVEYLDVKLKKGRELEHTAKKGYASFCYVIEGAGDFDGAKLWLGKLVLFSDSGKVTVKAVESLRYIFVTGKQLKEPVAWGGPIVMNTQEELATAFEELDQGTFIKQKAEAEREHAKSGGRGYYKKQ